MAYTTYLSYGSEDAALWRLVAVEGDAGDEAEQADGHGSGGDPEADVHPGAGLHPDEHGECHQLAHAEAEVGGVEVARQAAGVAATAAPTELVGAVRDDVGLEAPAAQRHQVERREEDAGLQAARLLARLLPRRRRHHVAWRRTELGQVRLNRQQDETLPVPYK